MPPESPEVRIAVLEAEVKNLRDGHGEIRADVKALTEKLNGFMLKTAAGTAALTTIVQLVVREYL